jgi:alkylation response protein AidB-like acyl-CoA dehydrogenase
MLANVQVRVQAAGTCADASHMPECWAGPNGSSWSMTLLAHHLLVLSLPLPCVLPQAMFLMSWRLSKLAEAGLMTHEQASLVKAWNTLRGREVCLFGLQCLGAGAHGDLPLPTHLLNSPIHLCCTSRSVT